MMPRYRVKEKVIVPRKDIVATWNWRGSGVDTLYIMFHSKAYAWPEIRGEIDEYCCEASVGYGG